MPMPENITGIHHITAIAGDPRQNLDFYTRTLGLRLVKRTVNFDDPGVYHFYFGGERGAPGTILTFFPWGETERGVRGAGQLASVAFSVPAGALPYWQEWLSEQQIKFSGPFTRFDDEVLAFADPDGLPLELVASAAAAPQPAWRNGPIPAEAAVRGLAAPTLLPLGGERTAHLLSEVFGFAPLARVDGRTRYSAGPEEGASLDIELRPDEKRGRMGAGAVHHIALRVQNEAEQLAWREVLLRQGFNVTQPLDRLYFRSIYFREPGGILFELATGGPGFTIDEPAEALGAALMLPPWLESSRAEIERALPGV